MLATQLPQPYPVHDGEPAVSWSGQGLRGAGHGWLIFLIDGAGWARAP